MISKALENHKIFNSSLLENDEILLKDFVNIGIAVDTPDGLVVPVIKDAPKNIREISDEISLYRKAKKKNSAKICRGRHLLFRVLEKLAVQDSLQ